METGEEIDIENIIINSAHNVTSFSVFQQNHDKTFAYLHAAHSTIQLFELSLYSQQSQHSVLFRFRDSSMF